MNDEQKRDNFCIQRKCTYYDTAWCDWIPLNKWRREMCRERGACDEYYDFVRSKGIGCNQIRCKKCEERFRCWTESGGEH